MEGPKSQEQSRSAEIPNVIEYTQKDSLYRVVTERDGNQEVEIYDLFDTPKAEQWAEDAGGDKFWNVAVVGSEKEGQPFVTDGATNHGFHVPRVGYEQFLRDPKNAIPKQLADEIVAKIKDAERIQYE